MKKLKVLISAYACEPNRGSEPGIGWNWVNQIARFHDVWVITRANNKEHIEQSLEDKTIPNLHWIYFDLSYWIRFWKKGARGVQIYYYLWQIGAYFIARLFHKKVGFQLTHHVTFTRYWTPSFISLLPIPFIWGPVGGGESTPRALYKTLRFHGRLYEVLRNIARWIAHIDPFVRLTAHRASISVATTKETAVKLRTLGAKRVIIHSNVGLPQNDIFNLNSIKTFHSQPIRFFSIGRLLHWKGFHLGILAFSKYNQTCNETYKVSEYWIIGDGPERRNLENLVRTLGIENKVRFWGNLSRNEVLEKLAESNVLIHPSFHDSGGWVCAEAMAVGKPVICLDIGGPALQVTSDTGIKIPVGSPEQIVKDIYSALNVLAEDQKLRIKKGMAARKRVIEHFQWNTKGEIINSLYEKIF